MGADQAYLRQLERGAQAAIRAAFPDEDPPPSEELENPHCPECSEVAARFSGKRWVDMTVADLAGNPPVTLLTASAFRYYLPALMLRCVEAPGALDCLPEAVMSMLSPPNGKPGAILAELRQRLDEAQRIAVCAFLAVLEAREKMDRYPPEAFESAPASKPLARAISYWSRREGRA
jgi:hypothetical protein